MELDVELVTCHWKLPHELGDGIVMFSEIQVPAYDGAEGAAGVEGTDGAGAAGTLGTFGTEPGAVGARILVSLWTEHAADNVATAASAARWSRVLFIVRS
jgi:hypothetical protein